MLTLTSLPTRLVLLTMLCVTCLHASNFSIRSHAFSGTTYIHAADMATYYGMAIHRVGDKDVLLKGKERSLELTINSRNARLNGTKVNLSFAVRESKDEIYLSERDFSLLIDPVFRDWSIRPHRIQRIILDAGHGGKDDGAKGARVKEKQMVLQVTMLLRDMLRESGYEVVLTRSDDTFIELYDRPKIASKKGGDLFISLHFNASASKSAAGIETYALTPQHTPSTPKSSAEDDACRGNVFDRENHRLAFEIQRYLIGHTGANDRGLRRHRFAVLREAPCPAVLVEMGFVSNPSEERQIMTSAYRKQLAAAVANGIIAYHYAIANSANYRAEATRE